MGLAARQPTETELKAHRRRAAFREKIAESAAALVQKKSARPWAAARESFSFPPMKEPWFSIEVTKTLKVREIQDVVCERYGLTLTQLLAHRRYRPLVRTRQIAMYLCKELTGKSLPEIGRRFGRKDHTTVLHAARKIALLIDPNSQQFDGGIAVAVKALRAELEARLG